ncbi:hypothetical protein [Xanthomonas vasicola]|uniref:hypothetical protein n=1 Tax=Xanthomonas vasicola TaxID=56459 RepID=UPI00034BECC6|nr:hypothetical protein [Xanthomonas vasicola]
MLREELAYISAPWKWPIESVPELLQDSLLRGQLGTLASAREALNELRSFAPDMKLLVTEMKLLHPQRWFDFVEKR